MREILFRGKRIDNGEWVYGWYCPCPFGRWPLKAAIVPSAEAEHGYHSYVEVDPNTLGQYTGLDDKNGKKIFEGDILAYYSDYRNETDIEGVVRYGNFNCSCCDGVYGWYVDGGDIRYLDGHASLHIIGNVHGNPELLNGGANE